MNYYEIFQLPISAVVDRKLLSKNYIDLQKKYHPDFFTKSTEEEKEDMLRQSAKINEGYQTLKNNEKTIAYFLKIAGAITDDEKYQLSPDFLMEMMDINETITDIDQKNAEVKINEIEKILDDQILEKLGSFTENSKKEELLILKEYYYKKKYLQRILDRLVD